jgi:hypothetical protein
MSISMGITDRMTGVMVEDVPVCTTATFRQFWLPAAQELGLGMIEALPALWVTQEYRERFLDELRKLEKWALKHEPENAYFSEMRSRIRTVAVRVGETPLTRFEICFG